MKKQTGPKKTKKSRSAALVKAAPPSDVVSDSSYLSMAPTSLTRVLIDLNRDGDIVYSFDGGDWQPASPQLLLKVQRSAIVVFSCDRFPIAVGLINKVVQGDSISFRVGAAHRPQTVNFVVPPRAQVGDEYKFSVAVFLDSQVGRFQPGDILVSDPILRIRN